MMKKKHIIAIIIFLMISPIWITAQNVGINLDTPQARLHVKNAYDVQEQEVLDFEDGTIPSYMFSGSMLFTNNAAQGSWALQSDPTQFVCSFEIDATSFVPDDKLMFISYYLKYDLMGIGDDLIISSDRIIEGPASSDWQFVRDTVIVNNIAAQIFNFSGIPGSYFAVDSISISYNYEESNTFIFDDSFQKAGYILSCDDSGRAKWAHASSTTAGQYPILDNAGQLLLIGYPTKTLDILNLKNENARLYLDPSSHLRWFGNGASTAQYAVNLGLNGTTNGNYSATFGNNNSAEGDNSFSIGLNNKASSFAEMAIGTFPTLRSSASAASWQDEDYLFVAGNGTSLTDTSNAFTVLKNGYVGVGDIIPTDTQLEIKHSDTNEGLKIQLESTGTHWFFTVDDNDDLLLGKNGTYKFIWDDNAFYNYSDSRLKQNFVPLSASLSSLMKIPIYRYSMDDKDNIVGVKAQDVHKIFPELIHFQERRPGGKEYHSVNYQGLNIHAIAALQELNTAHVVLQEAHDELAAKVLKLEAMVADLIKKE